MKFLQKVIYREIITGNYQFIKGTVVNRTLPSINGLSLEITAMLGEQFICSLPRRNYTFLNNAYTCSVNSPFYVYALCNMHVQCLFT